LVIGCIISGWKQAGSDTLRRSDLHLSDSVITAIIHHAIANKLCSVLAHFFNKLRRAAKSRPDFVVEHHGHTRVQFHQSELRPDVFAVQQQWFLPADFAIEIFAFGLRPFDFNLPL
jgi:hypothetical protein